MDGYVTVSNHRLARLLTPRSMACVGVSGRPGSVGRKVAQAALSAGFSGSIDFVNPRYESVEGRACAASLLDLEAVPDLVVAAVGGERLEALLEEAILMGAGGAVIFDDCSGQSRSGAPLQARLREMAREADFPVCGGNAMGFFNLSQRCSASFYDADHLKPGGITLIAHSGSVVTVLTLNDPRYRFDLIVSCGQEIGVSIDEYMDFALERAETRVIAIFMEGARHPEGFAAALGKAAARGVPVVVCKAGRTAESARLARSHSGAMAGSDAAYQALLERHGAILVETVDQLMNAALLLAQGRPMGLGGAAFVTDSGGLREALIDRAAARGIDLAELSPKTRARLTAMLPPQLVASNPLDGAADFTENFHAPFKAGLEIFADAPEVALLGYEFDGRDDHVYDPKMEDLAHRLPALTTKPCFGYSSFANAHNRALADRLGDAGLPVINGLDEALSAVAAAMRWRQARADLQAADPPPPAPDPEIVAQWRRRLGDGDLEEAAGLALLADFGVPAVPCRVVEGREALIAAARELGYPLVLKTAMPGLDHKSDSGGVRLNLTDREALLAAYDDLAARLGPRAVLQPMAPKGVELAFGCVVDPDFGPLVMLAAGGILIELLADRVFALAPFGPATAGRMIARLKCRALLEGLRGAPPCDQAALAAALAAFSVLAAELGDLLSELDVNPVILGPKGLVAVDALVTSVGQSAP